MARRAAALEVGLLLLSIASSCAVRASRTSDPGAAPGECVAIDAANEPAGLAGERAWLQEKYPGSKTKSQDLGRDGDRVLDLLVVVDAAGVEHSVCFDITAWFGKF